MGLDPIVLKFSYISWLFIGCLYSYVFLFCIVSPSVHIWASIRILPFYRFNGIIILLLPSFGKFDMNYLLLFINLILVYFLIYFY